LVLQIRLHALKGDVPEGYLAIDDVEFLEVVTDCSIKPAEADPSLTTTSTPPIPTTTSTSTSTSIVTEPPNGKYMYVLYRASRQYLSIVANIKNFLIHR
jgi:hypothetical protein